MAQPNLPASMRAVRQRDKLTPELALAHTPVPVPSQPADVLVEVAATALCYSELTWVSQNPRFFPPDKEPVPGQDMSGTVVQDGSGSLSGSSSKPGDQVFCRIDATRAGVGIVVGVCSTDKLPQVQDLGATAVVDYRKQEIGAWIGESPRKREFDLFLDCVGGDSMMGMWTAVRDGGEFISVCDMPDRLRPEGVVKTLKKSEFFIARSLGSQLADVSRLLEQGRVKPLVDCVYAFEDYQEAFDKLNRQRAGGEIVIKASF